MKPFAFLVFTLLSSAIFTAPISAQDSSANATPFADVPPNHWAAPAVKRLAELGIIEGFPGEVPVAPRKPMAKVPAKAKAAKLAQKPMARKKAALPARGGVGKNVKR